MKWTRRPVYVNASTRFTDGSVFGFGAEIGISTQSCMPVVQWGLNELTSTKYIIYGDGQILRIMFRVKHYSRPFAFFL